MVTCLDEGGTGAMAQQILISSKFVYRIPQPTSHSPRPTALPLETCSNIGRNYFAAFHSLKTIGEVGPHSLVLISGASGGVGMACIELAKAMGATVIAGVSTAEKAVWPPQVGADATLVYGKTKASFRQFKQQVLDVARTLGHPIGVDLVVDMVQGNLFHAALTSVVRPLGTIALVGFAAGQQPIRPGVLLVKELKIIGSLWGRWAMEHPEEHAENVQQIISYLATGAIRSRVDRVFQLGDYDKAFRLYETNQGRGNTVVNMRNSDEVPTLYQSRL